MSNRLKDFAERRLRLDGEIDALKEDVATINQEVKSEGYTLAAFNLAVKRLRMTPEKRQAVEQVEMDFGMYWEVLMGQGSEE